MTDGVLPDGTIKNEHILPAFVNGQVSLAYKHTTQHILILKWQKLFWAMIWTSVAAGYSFTIPPLTINSMKQYPAWGPGRFK